LTTLEHTYDAPGTYTATLSVVNRAQLTATASASVVVGAATEAIAPAGPTAVLSVSPGSGRAPLVADFDGSASSDPAHSFTSWQLVFGDGSKDVTGTGHPPSKVAHSYTTAGTYTATLTVTDGNGLTGSAVAQVKVSPAAPVASLTDNPSSGATGIHKIKHVIIIMQENRSFDDYFGTYPGADGIPMQNGVPTVCVPDPEANECIKPYHDTSDVNIGGPHGGPNQRASIDGGKMDGFIGQAESEAPGACRPSTPSCAPPPGGYTDVMGYHTAAEIPNYWLYANHYVLNDQMFETNQGYSLPSHLGLVSLWSASCSQAGNPQSCVSALNPPQPPNADYPWTDLTWLLHRAGVSWQYFVYSGGNPDCADDAANCEATQLGPDLPSFWNPLPLFDDVKEDGQLGNIVNTSQFYPEARNGTLPSVAWISPTSQVSEHGPSRVSAGQAYVTGLINAVMEGPDWDSTAIFVSWDEYGGYYDNVPPPVVDMVNGLPFGYGLRVPGLVISPYAIPGKIDDQVLSFDAYAKFIEDDFLSGQRLDPATDGRPDPRPDVRENAAQLGKLQVDFNFNQTPLPPLILDSGPPWGPVSSPSRVPGTAGGTAPLSVDFDGAQSSDFGGSITSWSLDFGDGTAAASGAGPPPALLAHTYTTLGTDTATLVVVNQAGLSASTTATIQVEPPSPVPTLSAEPPGGLAASTTTFDASQSTAPHSSITSWSLNFGDGSKDGTGTGRPPSKVTHTYTQAGDYGVTLTVKAANGTTATAPFEYIVKPGFIMTSEVAPPSGSVPSTLATQGTGFSPNETVDITLDGQPWSTAKSDSTGSFSDSLTIPSHEPVGSHTVTATGASSGFSTSQPLTVYANFQAGNPAAAGVGLNPYETDISVSNVASLVPAPWWGTATPSFGGAPDGAYVGTPDSYQGLVFDGSADGFLYEWSLQWLAQFQRLFAGGSSRQGVTSYPVTTAPVILGTGVYVGSGNGQVYGYHNSCGPDQGSFCPLTLDLAVGSATDPIASLTAASGNRLYVGTESGNLSAITPSSGGKVLWTTTLGGPVVSEPAVSSGTVVVGAGHDVVALNTSNGNVLWTATTGGTVTSSPAIENNTVYIGSGDGKLYAYPLSCAATCTPQWSATTGGAVDSSPALAYGDVFFGSNDGNLYAYSTTDHSLQWEANTGSAVSSPSVANGVVYAGTADGKVDAANADGCGGPTTCSPLWSAQTGGAITSAPDISNGQVLVASGDGHMSVYTLPAS
jgi:phospholipase C